MLRQWYPIAATGQKRKQKHGQFFLFLITWNLTYEIQAGSGLFGCKHLDWLSLCVRANNRCLCAYKTAAGRERPALRVSPFETDTGELLFSGLTPNLPLMDRPPNSGLLWAHSGAARSKGRPLSLSFGKEMDQPTVCQVRCQGSPTQSNS